MNNEKICLDTDVIQAYLRNDKDVVQKIAEIERKADLATTEYTAVELYCFAAATQKAKENTKVVSELLDRLTILRMSREIAQAAAKIITDPKQKASMRDTLVGMIAKKRGYLLFTQNEAAYSHIPGAKVYK